MTQPHDNSKTPQPFHIFLLWRVLAVITVPLLIAAVGTFFVLLNFNPNRYAPALVMALEQITGRQVTLNGPVTIHWSLTPAIQARDIAIATPPGFPNPDILTLGGLRAEIALLPLLSHHADILKLVLLSPHLTLERLPNGTADWDFSSTTTHPAARAMPFLNSSFKIALEAVEVDDGLLTIQANDRKTVGIIHFTKLTGTAASLSAPLHFNAQADIGTMPFNISGIVGPIERFSGIGGGPWPLDLDVTTAGANLNIAGTVAHPRDASGYDLSVSLNIPSLDSLAQALPPEWTHNLPLPPIQNIAAAARVQDRGTTLPAISGLTITTGQSDLSALRPGLSLDSLDIEMPALDQPLSVTATGISDSGKFSLEGQFGSLQNLFNPTWLPAGITATGAFPISVTAQLGNASATVTGAIATPQTLSGAALAITANIPDLSALSAIAGMPLPAWKQISLQTTLIDPGGQGLSNAAGLDDLTVTMDDAAFGGAATLNFTPQPKLQMAINFTQANVDALLAAYPAQAATVPTAPVTVPVTASAPATPPPVNTAIIPNTPLPLGFLAWGNADIQLSADNVIWNGATYTALQANAQLANGKLTINPLTGEIPGGDIAASASLDDSISPPAETLSIKAPALALGPLLKALNLSGTAEGNVQLQLTATSNGDTLHHIAANLNGQLGLASVNDMLDASLLDRALGPVEKAAGLPPPATTPATIRCFGLRLDAAQGVATLRTLGIDSSPLLLRGSGSLSFAQETYNVTLQPANGTQILLAGSFSQPTLTPSPPSPQSSTPQQHPDICHAALTLARLGQPGPAAPPPATATTTSPVPASPNAPKNLLNALLSP